MTRRLLVTGGAGFLGSNFVHHVLSHSDDSVTVLDKLTYAANTASLASLPPDRFRLVVGDVTDAASVDPLVGDADAVVHFAAESHNDRGLQSPRTFVDTNISGTFTVLEAVRAHGTRLHHVSTDEVFGELPLGAPQRHSEGDPYRPSSPYSASKAGADMLVRAWVRSYGVRATISNSSNCYGPYQHIEKFIPRQITNVLRGVRPQVYGRGQHVRDWLHAQDHSAAVLAILERGQPGRTYLIGGSDERDNRSVVELILTLMGRPQNEYDFVGDRPGHDLRYAVDPAPLMEELGWEPRYPSFVSGLKATIDWYRDHETWWASLKDRTEEFYRSVRVDPSPESNDDRRRNHGEND